MEMAAPVEMSAMEVAAATAVGAVAAVEAVAVHPWYWTKGMLCEETELSCE